MPHFPKVSAVDADHIHAPQRSAHHQGVGR